jgi:modulator of FtsH protease
MYNRLDQASSYAQPSITANVMARVLGLLGFSFAFTTVGALVGTGVGPGSFALGLIGSLVSLIALRLLKESSPINLILLYTFATMEGILLSGILDAYVQVGLGGAVIDAAGTTAVVTLGASAYGITTRRDLSKLRGAFTIALLALLAALIIGLFVHLAALQLAIAVIGALLFTGFITLDMQRVARARAASGGDTILMAVSVYLDIVNLFLFLLQIFGMGGRRR